MATLLTQNAILQVTFYQRFNEQTGLIVRHWNCSAPVAPSATDKEATDRISQAYAPLIKPLMHPQARYLGCVGQIVYPVQAASVTSVEGAGVGTSGDEVLPPQNTGLISLRTNSAGRSGRGRAYIPFPPLVAINAGGTTTLAYQANLLLLSALFTDVTELTVDLVINTFIPVVYQRATGLRKPITSVRIREAFATQRRRSFVNKADASPF